MRLDHRQSGILLHVTSLPNCFGVGDFGSAAFHFLDYLSQARQSLWQILPLGPTSWGGSPYSSPSAFAGNPLLIALEPLLVSRLVTSDEVDDLRPLSRDQVDFRKVVPLKKAVLRRAYERARGLVKPQLDKFRAANVDWLADFALFSALLEDLGGHWTEWGMGLRCREPQALATARERLADRVEYEEFCQFLFHEQWASVRARAAALGIAIIGDVPMFVAHNSADVWAHQNLFKLDAIGRPRVVAGVPPDYFSPTGQVWDNPVYNWVAMAEDGYQWWVNRIRHTLGLVDLVRIDHFRGFEAVWEIAAGETSAQRGEWVPGPGKGIVCGICNALGGGRPPLIAEDLGIISDEVRELLDVTAIPGMKVLQFAFGGGADNAYLPHNYPNPNCVVYTGTHDNDTTQGWFATLDAPTRDHVTRYIGCEAENIPRALTRLAWRSVANTAIVPLQDVLGLGTEARFNRPGQIEGSWTWRARDDQLDAITAEALADLTILYGRG